MRISDWSSDVCSSDLLLVVQARHFRLQRHAADRAGAGADLAHFRVPRAGVGGAGQRRVGFGIGWLKIFVGAGEGALTAASPTEVGVLATLPVRSEKRRVGKAGVLTGSSPLSPCP